MTRWLALLAIVLAAFARGTLAAPYMPSPHVARAQTDTDNPRWIVISQPAENLAAAMNRAEQQRPGCRPVGFTSEAGSTVSNLNAPSYLAVLLDCGAP